jgi:hypothetical protein
VWRRSELPLEDPRSIRKYDDLSFFDYEGRKPSGFLYEAKTSCVITGTDERTWCGYCFIEAYFDSAKDAKETAVEYWEDSQLSEGMYADPFTYGTTDTDVQIQDPRVYFLAVLASRIKRVEREWSNLVEMLEESINESPKVRSSLLLHFFTLRPYAPFSVPVLGQVQEEAIFTKKQGSQ